MNKWNVYGMILLAAGGVIIGFKFLKSFMIVSSPDVAKTSDEWDKFNLTNLIGEEYFEWVETIPWDWLYNNVDYVINLPLFILLFALGGICLLIGAFNKS